MKVMEAGLWVASVCVGLRKSQTKTLSALVAARLRVGRVSLSELGPLLAQERRGAAKHAIKRVWRFTSNHRIEVGDAMQGPLRWLFDNRMYWKRRPLVVSVDWTQVGLFHTLMVAAMVRGRGVPLLWASYQEWELHKCQNNLEEGMLRLLKSLSPEWIEAIVLADRGFGRTELARTYQQLGMHYVIRVKLDVYVECAEFRGKLTELPVRRGTQCRLKDVQFRKRNPALREGTSTYAASRLKDVHFHKPNPVTHHGSVCWQQELPYKRNKCQYLTSDLPRRPK